MGTQMSAARRGVATEEMKRVAKDEDVTLEWLIPKIASGSINIDFCFKTFTNSHIVNFLRSNIIARNDNRTTCNFRN